MPKRSKKNPGNRRPRHALNATNNSTTSPPRRVVRAHEKHHQTTQPVNARQHENTLSHHFHALPPELRAEIFSHILVRPLKWSLQHSSTSCARNHHNEDIAPSSPTHTHSCVGCGLSSFRWRQIRDASWTNPGRSHYAPEKRNELMCSDCWDERFREEVEGRPWPRGSFMMGWKCLCARRTGLECLLVSRQWYAEAGWVLYTRNTFAFESAGIFVDFVCNLPEQWRRTVGRVSLMIEAIDPQSEDATSEEKDSGFESSKKLAPAWSALRQLSALSYLELDAHFLTHPKMVRAMLRLGLRQVRSVLFTARKPTSSYSLIQGNSNVYPHFHQSILLTGGLAEEVARAIKGQRLQRCRWLKRPAAAEEAAADEWVLQQRYAKGGLTKQNGAVVNYEDEAVWERLFWRDWERGYERFRVAYLRSETERRQVGHWREARRGCVQTADLLMPDVGFNGKSEAEDYENDGREAVEAEKESMEEVETVVVGKPDEDAYLRWLFD